MKKSNGNDHLEIWHSHGNPWNSLRNSNKIQTEFSKILFLIDWKSRNAGILQSSRELLGTVGNSGIPNQPGIWNFWEFSEDSPEFSDSREF
jgi:hypothetical protein